MAGALRGFAVSQSKTCLQLRPRLRAALSPAGPPPTMITSNIEPTFSLLAWCGESGTFHPQNLTIHHSGVPNTQRFLTASEQAVGQPLCPSRVYFSSSLRHIRPREGKKLLLRTGPPHLPLFSAQMGEPMRPRWEQKIHLQTIAFLLR